MISYEWKILDILGENDLMSQVKYRLKATDGENSVETEGYWDFPLEANKRAFKGMFEADVIKWFEEESTQNQTSVIKSNLENQLASLSKIVPISKPWDLPTFKVKI
jgi:hypothetical protein